MNMGSDSNRNQTVHVPRRWRKFAVVSALTLGVLSAISLVSMDVMSNHLRYHYWNISRQIKRRKKKSVKTVPPTPAPEQSKKKKKKNRKTPAPVVVTLKAKKNKKKKKGTVQTPMTGAKESTAVETGEGGGGIELVMLLAFPFSGTNTLLHVVQSHSKLSMATNYGDAIETNYAGTVVKGMDSIPIEKDRPGGPFKYKLEWPLPEEGGILVKTHCSGHCFPDVRGCGTQALPPKLNLEQFYKSCFTSSRYSVRARHNFYEMYDSSRAKKAILLVRDPLDIVLARFMNWNEGRGMVKLANQRGLFEWCDEYDAKSDYLKWIYKGLGDGLWEQAQDVKCHAELYRIISFYKYSMGMVKFRESLGTEFNIHVVHFDDYDTDYEATKDGIFEFANIQQKRGGKHYKKSTSNYEYFGKDDKEKAVRFIRGIIGGDKELKRLLKRYI